jgi:predicted nucleotidyltransferase
VTIRRPVESLSHPDLPDPTVLQRIADRLRQRLGATRVIVYGSVARGEATIHSDVDLLVVAPSTESSYWRMAHAHAAVRDLSFRLPISPLVLTPEELATRLERGDPFIGQIVREGIEL